MYVRHFGFIVFYFIDFLLLQIRPGQWSSCHQIRRQTRAKPLSHSASSSLRPRRSAASGFRHSSLRQQSWNVEIAQRLDAVRPRLPSQPLRSVCPECYILFIYSQICSSVYCRLQLPHNCPLNILCGRNRSKRTTTISFYFTKSWSSSMKHSKHNIQQNKETKKKTLSILLQRSQ